MSGVVLILHALLLFTTWHRRISAFNAGNPRVQALDAYKYELREGQHSKKRLWNGMLGAKQNRRVVHHFRGHLLLGFLGVRRDLLFRLQPLYWPQLLASRRDWISTEASCCDHLSCQCNSKNLSFLDLNSPAQMLWVVQRAKFGSTNTKSRVWNGREVRLEPRRTRQAWLSACPLSCEVEAFMAQVSFYR